MTCHCSLGDPAGHSHDLPPNRCYCTDREITQPSDHWPTCPKYRPRLSDADRAALQEERARLDNLKKGRGR